MKKYVLTAVLIGTIGIASSSFAGVRGNYGYGPGPGFGYCDGPKYCDNAVYYDDSEKTAAFQEETKDIKKQIFVKRSELDALMRQDNPDETKVSKLTGELYDLQSLMVEKADKAFGDSPRYSYGRGRGYCNGGRRGW